MEKNFDEVTFVKDFVELADMHNSFIVLMISSQLISLIISPFLYN